MASSIQPSNLVGGQQPTEAHDTADLDDDSAYDGDSISESWTTSLKSSIFNYREMYGRTYHAHDDEGRYAMPNDQPELDRLDLQHHMCVLSNKGKLFLAPISETPQNVLDIGTGTGIWAIEFADQYPTANVVGTDLSPTQPSWIPPNVRFEIDDANETWTFSTKFDYIHCRYFHMSIEEKKLFKQSYEALSPGGWFEIRETMLPVHCDDGTLDGTALMTWSDELFKLTREPENPLKYRQWLEEAGFVNVQEHVKIHPISPWPEDEHLRQLGNWVQFSLGDGIESFSIVHWTEKLGLPYEECQKFLTQVRKDIHSNKIHGYLRSITVFGQKPQVDNPPVRTSGHSDSGCGL